MIPDQSRIQFLLQQYSAGSASPEETRELFGWIRVADDDAPLRAYMQGLWQQTAPDTEFPSVNWDDMFSSIVHRSQTGPKEHPAPATANEGINAVRLRQHEKEYPAPATNRNTGKTIPVLPQSSTLPNTRSRIWAIAAACVAIAVVALGGYQLSRYAKTPPPVTQQTTQPVKEYANHTQHLLLPDSSTVVLHAGSTLQYLPGLSGNTREVLLDGEAYFDIKQDLNRPFIILSHKLKTTVLGTAFNIRAFEKDKQITVTVTQGKVKVEDEQKVLGIVLPDKRMIYDTQTATAYQEGIIAEKALDWVRQDVVYEAKTFEFIAAKISLRYQVPVKFENEALKNCLITASFSGTESLEDMLTVVCTARNATYTINNGKVTIHGKGCTEH